jgi:hypothetical protein
LAKREFKIRFMRNAARLRPPLCPVSRRRFVWKMPDGGRQKANPSAARGAGTALGARATRACRAPRRDRPSRRGGMSRA